MFALAAPRRLLALARVLVLLAPPLAGAAAPAAAQGPASPRPFAVEDILTLQNVSDPQLSPDGKWVAYVVTVTDMKANATNSDIWLVSAAGGAPRQLTRSPRADGSPRWSPDGQWLAFVSAREERAQIYRISPFGGEAERLTDSKTGVGAIQWSPDGTRIAFTATQAPTPEQEQKQRDRDDAIVVDTDFRMGRIWVVDVATREATELVKEAMHASDPQWSPDGTRIAFSATPTPRADDGFRSDVYVVDARGGAPRKLVENDGPDTAPRWSPDGRYLAISTRPLGRGAIGLSRLAIIPAEGGAPRLVAPAFDYSAGGVTWSADGRTLWFTAGVGTTAQLFAVPATGGTPRALTDHQGMLGGLTMSADRSQVAFTFSTIQRPAEVHVAATARPGQPTRLTDHNAAVSQLALGRSEVIRWRSTEGREIEGILIYPVDYQPGRRYPVMANIHGGPSGVWTQSFPGSYGNFAHVWAGRGWLSFFPNVRGSSNYGEEFLVSNVRDWGGGDYRDIQTGLDTLVARGIADPDRMAQSGWSYGGYMTAWTITQTNRFKAAMVGAGLTNMFSMYSTNDLQSTLDAYFGAEPWDDREAYDRASALMFIKQASTPTLIMHGQQDLRVPIGQAQELYQGLKRNNVPVELVFYPRAGHGLGEPRHQLDKMQREVEWFTRWVLGVGATP